MYKIIKLEDLVNPFPPESQRNFLCSSRMSLEAMKLCDTTASKNRKPCASSPVAQTEGNSHFWVFKIKKMVWIAEEF